MATARILPPSEHARVGALLNGKYPVAKRLLGVFNALVRLVRRSPKGQQSCLAIVPE